MDFDIYRQQLKQRLDPSVTIMQGINSQIRKTQKKIVFADGEDENTLKAAIAFKYSKLGKIIDSADTSVTSNITRVIIRRNMKVLLNQSAQYEICYGNSFKKNAGGFNIKSTGFTLASQTGTLYFTDVPDASGDMGVLNFIFCLIYFILS